MKDSAGVHGEAQVVELNVMLGTQEGLATGTSPTEEARATIFVPGSNPYPVAATIRGVRISRRHQQEFPSILVGFGNVPLLPNMKEKDKDDCLVTLQTIQAKIEYDSRR